MPTRGPAGRLAALLVASGLLLSACGGAAAPDSVYLDGAGATFPYPLYSKWFHEYYRLHPNILINYQSIGSGGGQQQLLARTVDFGASDEPMPDELLRQAGDAILHVPTVAGAVVLTYNLPGLEGELRLTPEALAGIFLGHVRRWNDPLLARANPELDLPAARIVVVHRSDGSGTTNIFTRYLSAVSPKWRERVGAGTAVAWPVGIAAKGNEGVATQISQLAYSIGYIELAYAVENRLPAAAVRNRAGEFVRPAVASVTKAVEGAVRAGLPADFRAVIVDQPGPQAYPISGLTWILLYRHPEDARKGRALLDFLDWALTEGQRYAAPLHYAPLPPSLTARVREALQGVEPGAGPPAQGPAPGAARALRPGERSSPHAAA